MTYVNSIYSRCYYVSVLYVNVKMILVVVMSHTSVLSKQFYACQREKFVIFRMHICIWSDNMKKKKLPR